MSSLKQIVRSALAVFFGMAYLASAPLVAPMLAVALLHGDHEHELEVVEHNGHGDLVFHHTDDHDAHSDGEHPTVDDIHSDESPHGCHVVQLPSDHAASVASVSWLQAPLQLAIEVSIALPPVIAGWRLSEMPMRARPPPMCGSGVPLCLRTTVILV